LRDQRAQAFRFSSPVVSALHEPIDGGRKQFLPVARFPFHCAQLFDLHAQYVHLDEQQLEFPPHDRERIGRLPRLGAGKRSRKVMSGSGLIRHGL
jgi:hypothetical protein